MCISGREAGGHTAGEIADDACQGEIHSEKGRCSIAGCCRMRAVLPVTVIHSVSLPGSTCGSYEDKDMARVITDVTDASEKLAEAWESS